MNGYETTPEFQSTPPRGWRRRTPDTSSSRTYFNPLHHEGGDTVSRTFIPEPNYFNPLHHEGGDEYPLTRNFSLTCDFNPLHHEGGDLHFRHTFQPLGPISIHSTTRVETYQAPETPEGPGISIHSTTRVETGHIPPDKSCYPISIHSTTRVETFRKPHWANCALFQSTPPRGWRHKGTIPVPLASSISIHSTTRVETDIISGPSAALEFQSTPPREWRPFATRSMYPIRTFQSTPPRGWRPNRGYSYGIQSDFNPLHHEGGDATPEGKENKGIPISIHSTTRVETRHIPLFSYKNLYFNPLHHEGGDSFPGSPTDRFPLFQSTPPRGWRLPPRTGVFSPLADFNPLHHEGGDTSNLLT